jgi:predicted HTH transcriptional regulator
LELTLKLGLGKTTIQNSIVELKHKNIIKRIGAYKKGHWEVIK